VDQGKNVRAHVSIGMVRWAPLSIPIARRRQTFAVLLWIFLYPLMLLFFALIVYYQPLLAMLYLVYVVLDPAAETGGRPNSFVRNWIVWHWLRDYFPVQVVLEKPLDPTKNYLFGYHPHGNFEWNVDGIGIIGLGAFITFATNATGIEQLMPGIHVRLLTLALNFRMPIARDLFLCNVDQGSHGDSIGIVFSI
jgi:2-acylglycerol O-acyltransferase 2